MNSQNSPKPRKPVAPAPFRPQPVPKVLQRKVAVQPVNKPRVAPVAPPVYRPQPAPVVLQRKVRPELQSPAVRLQQKNPLAPKTGTAQLRKPAGVPPVNNIHAKANVAQQKVNSHRSGMVATLRGIPSRGIVQRAALPVAVAPAIRWYFAAGIPASVQRTLQTMVASVAVFGAVCDAVVSQHFIINVDTKEAVKGEPRAHFAGGTVYVAEGMNHDDMVNSIVFELTNAMHSSSLAAVGKIEDVDVRAENIERIEYQGVQVQAEIIKAAKQQGLVDKEMFGNFIGKGKRWETFDQYAKDQKASGHTDLYKK